MPDSRELEQMLDDAEDMEAHLDAYEISRLHTMAAAAAVMDALDREADDGNQ